MLSPAYLSTKLTSPLPTKDGGTLRTIGEACEYMAAIGKERELRPHWQQVHELMLQEFLRRGAAAVASARYRPSLSPSRPSSRTTSRPAPGRLRWGAASLRSAMPTSSPAIPSPQTTSG